MYMVVYNALLGRYNQIPLAFSNVRYNNFTCACEFIQHAELVLYFARLIYMMASLDTGI